MSLTVVRLGSLCLFALAGLLGGVAPTASAQSVPSTACRTWTVGQHLTITTTDCVYDAVVVDPATGRLDVVVQEADRPARGPETLYLIGATAGEQAGHGTMVFMRSIRTGLKMELGRGSRAAGDRVFSAPVTAIELGQVISTEAAPRHDRAA